MLDDFINYMLVVLEGGDAIWDDPNGGRTKFGFAQKFHPDVDVDALTLDDAKNLTCSRYYYKYHLERLPECVACLMLDWVFNAGPGCIRAMQGQINVRPDGIIGPHTSAAAFSHLRQYDLVSKLVALRVQSYYRKDDFPIFGRGWLTRIALCHSWIARRQGP